jgi:hypothetical protein
MTGMVGWDLASVLLVFLPLQFFWNTEHKHEWEEEVETNGEYK